MNRSFYSQYVYLRMRCSCNKKTTLRDGQLMVSRLAMQIWCSVNTTHTQAEAKQHISVSAMTKEVALSEESLPSMKNEEPSSYIGRLGKSSMKAISRLLGDRALPIKCGPPAGSPTALVNKAWPSRLLGDRSIPTKCGPSAGSPSEFPLTQ